jgi:hypothetical protein
LIGEKEEGRRKKEEGRRKILLFLPISPSPLSPHLPISPSPHLPFKNI